MDFCNKRKARVTKEPGNPGKPGKMLISLKGQ